MIIDYEAGESKILIFHPLIAVRFGWRASGCGKLIDNQLTDFCSAWWNLLFDKLIGSSARSQIVCVSSFLVAELRLLFTLSALEEVVLVWQGEKSINIHRTALKLRCFLLAAGTWKPHIRSQFVCMFCFCSKWKVQNSIAVHPNRLIILLQQCIIIQFSQQIKSFCCSNRPSREGALAMTQQKHRLCVVGVRKKLF